MKTSIEHLPPSSREELSVLRDLILQCAPQCRMIILLGSYAQNNYVLWEESIAFGRRRLYRSDYEMLVVVDAEESERIGRLLHGPVTDYYHRLFGNRRHATPRFVVETIAAVNGQIVHGNSCFTHMVHNGILLHDDRRYALNKPVRNTPDQIRQQAETGFENYYPDGIGLIQSVTSHFLPLDDYRRSALRLHGACEKFYAAILAVHTGYCPGHLPLDTLAGLAKRFSREIDSAFPRNNRFETTSYKLLCHAPRETRRSVYCYTRERLGYMLRGAEQLGTIARRVCAERIAHCGEHLPQQSGTPAPTAGLSAKM